MYTRSRTGFHKNYGPGSGEAFGISYTFIGVYHHCGDLDKAKALFESSGLKDAAQRKDEIALKGELLMGSLYMDHENFQEAERFFKVACLGVPQEPESSVYSICFEADSRLQTSFGQHGNASIELLVVTACRNMSGLPTRPVV